jgi:mevalonate kinase
MGSSAAVSISIARALKQHLALPLSTEQISSLAYEVEKLHHGTPSGIDNSVISYEQPVSFLRGREPKLLELGAPMDLIIGDTGVASPTSLAVRKVRQGWEQDRRYFESLFDQIAHLTRSAERALVIGDIPSLGPLMNHNQVLLEALGVSSPELARLILGAREAGALGAKLSGAGMGGNMIALVTKTDASEIQKAILASGAIGTIPVRVGP